MDASWSSPIYRETVAIVLSILFVSGFIVFLLRKKNYYFITAWASIRTWLVVAPLLMVLFGLPAPWPFVCLTALAVFGAKVFFQLIGMYHRNFFVLICYAGIVALGFASYYDRWDLFNQMPMMVLGASLFVPLIRNNYKQMIQYISLTLLAFIFLGWSFMHLGLILNFPSGVFQVMYLVVLLEFCDNTNLAIGRYFRGPKLFNRINPRRSLWGTVVSILLTLGLAYLMREMLPTQSEQYWLASGLVASIGGMFGDLVMTVVRKDAGVKVVGPFVLGRGDYLQRMDRLIFVAPIYYYVMRWLHG